MVTTPARRASVVPTASHLLQIIDSLLIYIPGLRVQAQIRTGRRAFAIKDWHTAAEHYGNALAASPGRPTVWVQYGHALKEGGDRPAAEKAYCEALKRRPDFADTYVQLGHVTKLMGRTTEAAAHYKRALKLKPDRVDAARELEWLDAQSGAFLAAEFFKSSPETRVRNRAAASTHTLSISFDVTSLITFFRAARQPTGIQRVQIEIVSALHRSPPPEIALSVCYFSAEDGCWFELPETEFARLRVLATTIGSVDAVDWRDATVAFETALADQPPASFPVGTFLINLGAPWDLQDYFLALRSVMASCGLTYVPLVYDLIPLVTPENCIPDLVHHFIGWVGSLFDHTGYLLSISEATKDHLLAAAATLGHTPRDVQVIRLDADCRNLNDVGGASDASVLSELGIGTDPYVLFVSTVEPRKNHLLAFSAWLQLIRSRGTDRTPRLVCVGGRGWMHEAVLPRLKASKLLQNKVMLFSGLSDSELATLYRGCLFTIYPSKFEGWGLPITESLCYGKIPLAARASSLPEAGGEFADYFELDSEADFVRQLERLIGDKLYRLARETLIADRFRPREWSALATEIVETITRWQRERGAQNGIAAALGGAEGIARFKLGKLYLLTQNREISIWPGMVIGEILRGGDAWWAPDDWGCWTKAAGAYLTFSTESTGEPLRGYLGLKGLPSVPCPYSIEISDLPPIKGILAAKETCWIPFVLPGRAGAATIRISLRGEATEDLSTASDRHDRRVVSLGVTGLMLCEESDVRSRMNMLEAIQFGDLALATDRPVDRFGPFPMTSKPVAG
jgi:glycosyltransferase involved in cell wall biosynthesis